MAKDLPHSKYSYGPRSSMWFLAFYLMISSTVARSAVLSTANVLIYSATRGLRHGSIPTAIDAIRSRSTGYNIAFEYTEDPTWFRDDKLGKYDAIVFLSTTGESGFPKSDSVSLGCNMLTFRVVLDARGKIAFQNYLNKGGNFVGIHAASDSLKSATFFGQEVGQCVHNCPSRQHLTARTGAYLDYYTPISAAVSGLTRFVPSPSPGSNSTAFIRSSMCSPRITRAPICSQICGRSQTKCEFIIPAGSLRNGSILLTLFFVCHTGITSGQTQGMWVQWLYSPQTSLPTQVGLLHCYTLTSD